jgi:hypothetical protein
MVAVTGRGGDGVTVGTGVATSTDGADLPEQLRRLGEFIVNGQARNEVRFDRLETDVAGLKTDVAGLKTDVAGLKTDVAELNDRVRRMDLAMHQRFDKITAQLESWAPHLLKKEEVQPPQQT